MAKEIIMPKAGMAMEFGTVVKWIKKEGDTVKKGEPILEITTDKVNMEIEAEVSGTLLKITAVEGEELPVFTVIGYIGKQGEVIEVKLENKEAVLKKSKSSKREIPKEDVEKNGKYDYDVVVIGGGPAGYIAAIKAAQLGGNVALVERDNVGGTCLNRGCIPTKTFLKTAEMIGAIKHAKSRGLIIKDPSVVVDMNVAIFEKNNVVKKLTGGISYILKSYGIDVIIGTGMMQKDHSVIIDGHRVVTGRSVILAGGSKVSRVKIPGIESKRVLDSSTILNILNVPKRLAIIGGGVIGVEMACIFNAFGSDVTIIEMMDRIVPPMDSDISEELRKQLKIKKIDVKTSVGVERLEEFEEGLKVYINNGTYIEVDYALLSIGRIPDLSCLGNLDIAIDKNRVKVNTRMETNISGIYAPGDINGLNMLAHAAYKMGEVAAENAMGERVSVDLRFVPGCIYTTPEVGSVGLTEEIARSKYDVSIGRFMFGANGRALATGEGVGFVKVIVDRKYGEILGVHIIGPSAAEMINEAAALMSTEITVGEAAGIIHGHPTYSEALMEAFNDALGKCLHTPKKK